MVKFVLCAALYYVSLFGVLHLLHGDQAQLRHELALDQAEFNQSLPEIDSLRSIDLSGS